MNPTCGRCGKTPPDGLASIGDTRYCHDPDGTNHESCYVLTLWQSAADTVPRWLDHAPTTTKETR